jgi:hypothetical protein
MTKRFPQERHNTIRPVAEIRTGDRSLLLFLGIKKSRFVVFFDKNNNREIGWK